MIPSNVMPRWALLTKQHQPAWLALGCLLIILSACGSSKSPDLRIDSADLNDDALLAPTPPELSASAEAGRLIFSWRGIDPFSSATIYEYDYLTGDETAASEPLISSPELNSWISPSHTHRRAWHRQQFRVELCEADNCLSSARISISNLAKNTTSSLTPNVFLQDERYGEHMASNRNASLVAVALPVEGAIELLLRSGLDWVVTQRISLETSGSSIDRKILLSLSDSGDTIALMVLNKNKTPRLKVLERFGEAWFETTSLNIDQTDDINFANANQETNEMALTGGDLSISQDENSIYLRYGSQARIYHRENIAWSNEPLHTLALTPAEVGANPTAGIVASSINNTFNIIHSLEKADNQLWLNAWRLTDSDTSNSSWSLYSRSMMDTINPDRLAHIKSSSTGDRVVVSGWENTGTSNQSPIMWRYQIPIDAATNQTATVLDSLRMAAVEHSDAVLSLSADESLTTIALSWQSSKAGNEQNSDGDAALTTYIFDDIAQRWLPALELPESVPVLAKQAFANQFLLSKDASSLFIASQASSANPGSNPAGHILVLR